MKARLADDASATNINRSLDVALPLLLAVGDARTVHTPRVGGKVADRGKALDGLFFPR